MKKALLNLIFTVFSLVFIKLAYADSCTDISERLDGQWSYTESGVAHTIEFKKNNIYLIHDAKQKNMWLCSYFPDLNVISFSLKNEYTTYRIDISKPNQDSTDEKIKLSINFKEFELTPSSDKHEDLTPTPSPATGDNTFKWMTAVAMDGHIFPSLIISTATLSDAAKELLAKNKQNKNLELLGDPLGLFAIAINNVKPDTKVKVEVSLGDFANNSVFEGVLKQQNKGYVIKPRVDYNYQQLLANKQPTPLNVKFSLYIDGEKIGEQFKTVTVRSVNDAPKASLDKNNQITEDLSWVFAAYVNENNPNIDALLREAINTGEINGFVGYQQGPQGVYKQVYSIWNVLQRRGVRYSSITTPTAVSEKNPSQYVRFMDDTLNTSQANCIDGTVLFASILRRIGINPKIILVPGHAFLGFDLDATGHQVAFLETTMIGNTDLGKDTHGKSLDETFSKILGVKSMTNQKSSNSFIDAINTGEMEARQAWPELKANRNPNYKVIDIDKVRKAGVAPINH